MKTKPTINRPAPFISMKIMKSVFSLVIMVAMTLLFVGCKEKAPKSEVPEVLPATNQKVHVAFAGGGWRAHTGHSAWTVSLLDNGSKTLSDVFANVGTMSSNSGGSWFSTMLMFSSDFVNDIQANDALSTWTTTGGWIGKQRQHFDAAPCKHEPEGIYLECVFDHYTNKSYTGGTYWKLMVEKLVFKDYPLGGTTLSDAHQPWAADKPLLLASTLLTNAVVLNLESGIGNNHSYYQSCLAPNTPIVKGDDGSTCTQGRPVDVSPATFSSIPKNSSYRPSPFLAELGTDTASGSFKLGYTADYEFENPPTYSNSVQLPLTSDNIPVMTAAAASSAAGGFGASEHITGLFDLSYTFSDDAVSFGLANAEVQYVATDGMDLKQLADQKAVRLADGGAVDNSGVAQLVRSLQLNNQADGFNIVAFDNVSTITTPVKGGASVGIDIASLFGYNDPLCVDLKLIEYCITTPDLQIFDSSALNATTATWTYGTGANQLVYTKYDVTTKANTVLGISGGTKGTLHSFTCAYPTAETAPIDGDTNFDAYDAMFKFIHTGLNDKSGEGLKYLQTALGF